jgi:hypothetical protein
VRKSGGEFIVITQRGIVLPVTNWIAPSGDDAAGQSTAAMCVAGTDTLGWYTIHLSGGFHHAH